MKYAESHEWVDLGEEGKGRIGISAKAKEELGEIVYVALPKVGQKVGRGDEVAVLESTKAAIDLYSPVSGIVCAVNRALEGNVSLLNRFPEGEGYLFEMLLSDPKELEELLSIEEYCPD